ncbi:tetratricopeptide repeat-containing sensor histidine kinase [Prolixibacter bellariivorans]|nr:tetratricopeptide repeat protein [Prolixibacter bellariivorans]
MKVNLLTGMLMFLFLILGGEKLYADGDAKTNLPELTDKSTLTDRDKIDMLLNSCFENIYSDPQTVRLQLPGILSYATRVGYEKGIADANGYYGVLYQQDGELSQAMSFYQKALVIYEKIGDERGAAHAHNNVGSIYHRRGKYVKALENYQVALNYYDSNHIIHPLITTLTNIASAYITIGLIDEAKEYNQRALNLAEKNGFKGKLATSLVNMGVISSNRHKLVEAKQYYTRALNVYKELDNQRGIANCLLNIGVILQKQGDMPLAFEHALQAMSLYKEMNDHNRISQCVNNIGVILDKLGSYDKAISYYTAALKIIGDMGVNNEVARIYNNLSKAYAGLENYKEALYYHEKYKSYSDSVLSLAKSQQIAELQTKYETQKKEQLIELQQAKLERQKLLGNTLLGLTISILLVAGLIIYAYVQKRLDNEKITQQNVEIARQNEMLGMQKNILEELNQTKDKLFSVIGHDLRGPIANMRSIFDMVLEDEFTDRKELFDVMKVLRDKTCDTHNLLENLLYWSRSQQGRITPNQGVVDLTELVEESLDLIKADAKVKGIDLEINMGEAVLSYCDADMINLVLRNLLSNAIKFTPSGGRILLKIEQSDKHIKVSVRDTGIGVPKENLPKLFDKSTYFTTYGTNKEKGSGLGLNLCREFVEANNGSIAVDSQLGKGSEFYFTLPLAGSRKLADRQLSDV